MATKTSKVGGGSPSVSDLLDKPPIRALADRWNRSVIASGVRSFLDELRSDLGRRGAESTWPSLRELAERAARHIVALQQSSERPAINATGRAWGAPWISRPQYDAALERAFAAGRDFVAGPLRAEAASLLTADVAPLLCRITGGPAATAVHSYAGGMWLALSALAAGQEVIVARAELGIVAPGCSLSDLIASSGSIAKEIGTTNRTSAADFEAAVTPQTAAVLKSCFDDFRVVGDTVATELEELVGLTRDRELTLIDALGGAALADLPATITWPKRSARDSLAAGADLAIVRGDGMMGGPACGILVGSREIVRRITEHPLFAAWQLDAPRSAALAAALQCHEDRSRGVTGPPLVELLATPLENLRNRAERLAPQLAQADGIESAEAVALLSHWDAVPTADRAIASFGVALTTADGDAATLERRLISAPLPVIGRIDGDRLLLDLRTVFPRQDQAIVEALAGQRPTDIATRAVAGVSNPA